MTKYILILLGVIAFFSFSFKINPDYLVAKNREVNTDSTKYKVGLKLFKRNCAVCHALEKMDIVGPTLNGIEERHCRKWITSFILDKNFRKKDKAAIEVIHKYSNAEHPDFYKELTKKDIYLILDFIKTKVASGILSISVTEK